MREILLLAWLAGPASAHPGAHQHLQATQADACDPSVRSRRVGALLDENQLDAARAELDRGRDCPLPSMGALVAEAQLAILEGHHELAESMLTGVLAQEPGHSGALFYRVTARTRLGQHALAAEDALALARQGQPNPSMWQQAIENLAATDQRDRFDAVCDEALEVLGPLPALTARVAELNLDAGRADRALVWLEHGDSPSHAILRARALQIEDPEAAPHAWEQARERVQAMRASPKRTELLAAIADRAPEDAL